MISKATIDKVYEAVRVEEVIQDYVQLKKSGANFKGLSPFTSERTPSFMVSPVKQIWKDFSSGKGGNAIAFLMEMEQYTYPEAIKHLAQKYNIEIEETAQSSEQKEAKDHQESLYLVTEFAQEYFQKQLNENAQGRIIGLSYFRERGFTEDTIKRFRLGFGGTDWQGLAKEALAQGYKAELLEESGVCFKVDSPAASSSGQPELRDRFRDRVIFPIQSTSGRVLGFGGRILDTQKKVAKYVNSPESPIYHKAKALYGIHFAKSAIAKLNNCYLVEGYTDVIQLHQRGVENVVSSSGTALTESQIRMIRRLCSTITLIFDADQAGIRASMRSIDLILAEGLNVRVLSLPEGEDPDSFARSHDYEEITAYFEQHQIDFITYKSQILLGEAKDAITKSEAIREIVKSIWHIGDPIKRELYIKQCVDTFKLSEAVVYAALADLESKEKRDARSRSYSQNNISGLEVIAANSKPTETKDRQKELERSLIESLLLYGSKLEVFDDAFLEADEQSGELISKRSLIKSKVYEKIYLDLQQDEMRFSDPVYSSLFDWVIRFYTEQQGEEIADLLKFLEKQQKEELIQHVSSIVFEYEQYALHQWERKNIYPKERKDQIAQQVSETILSLRSHWVQQHLSELQKRSVEEVDTNILEEVMDYLMLNKVLSKRLNRVLTV